MGKRIRHPKRKEKQEEIKQENKEEIKQEKTHFVLDVHSVTMGNNSKMGN